MSVDDAIKIMDALTKLTAVLAWPMLFAFFLVRFSPALKAFFESLSEFSVKGAGFEASAKRKQAEAVAALVAAAAKPDSGRSSSPGLDAREAVDLVQYAVTPRLLRKAAQANVLWVDDRPENNTYERQSLEALGINFVLATSTEQALAKLRDSKFNAIISDMGRPSDPRAGYTLLDQLRQSGNHTPFVIYASSNSPEHKVEARQHGALGCTNRASELFEYVVRAVESST
ncbi:response regulator [Aeromonas sp. MR7]|uniref:response regulator n=1 Tax=Aeromonas sp. MR7 TaxID=2923419 RepID=UPI001F4B10C2|nr:response regulator [Aeromonas sp. MR7]MCH7348330.1 response regulator [Aeromonas sp. MR7]